MPGKNLTFTTRVDPVSPPSTCPCQIAAWEEKLGGGAGHCPRVRVAYSDKRLSP